MNIVTLNKKNETKELLPQVIERIFSICKNDKNFYLKDELQIIENKMVSLSDKVQKQNNLLEQSTELLSDLNERNQILKNQIFKKQNELLEMLGSEL